MRRTHSSFYSFGLLMLQYLRQRGGQRYVRHRHYLYLLSSYKTRGCATLRCQLYTNLQCTFFKRYINKTYYGYITRLRFQRRGDRYNSCFISHKQRYTSQRFQQRNGGQFCTGLTQGGKGYTQWSKGRRTGRLFYGCYRLYHLHGGGILLPTMCREVYGKCGSAPLFRIFKNTCILCTQRLTRGPTFPTPYGINFTGYYNDYLRNQCTTSGGRVKYQPCQYGL